MNLKLTKTSETNDSTAYMLIGGICKWVHKSFMNTEAWIVSLCICDSEPSASRGNVLRAMQFAFDIHEILVRDSALAAVRRYDNDSDRVIVYSYIMYRGKRLARDSLTYRSSTILRDLAASSFWRARRASSLALIASSKKWLRSTMRAASRFLICSRSSSECTVVRCLNSSSCARSCVAARTIMTHMRECHPPEALPSRWAPSGRAARARTRRDRAQPRRRACAPFASAARRAPGRAAARWAPAYAPPRPLCDATRAPPPPASASRAVHRARPARPARAAAMLEGAPPRAPSRPSRAPAPSRRLPRAPMKARQSSCEHIRSNRQSLQPECNVNVAHIPPSAVGTRAPSGRAASPAPSYAPCAWSYRRWHDWAPPEQHSINEIKSRW